MTLLSYLIVLFPTRFSFVAIHGKVLQLSSKSLSSNTKEKKISIFSIDGIFRFLSKLQVSKSYFRHMYIVGVISGAIAIYVLLAADTETDIFFSYFDDKKTRQITMYNSNYNMRQNRKTKGLLMLALYELHVMRRLWECYYLTIYGDSTMHVAGYCCGILHYILAPMCLLCGANVVAGSSSLIHFNILISVTVYIIGSFFQFKSHFILYDMKSKWVAGKFDSGNSLNGSVQQKYFLPKGFLFDYVCCPHYFAEILVYFSLWFVSPQSPPLVCLLLWVISNLSIESGIQMNWYIYFFGKSLEFPNNWKRIFPYIW